MGFLWVLSPCKVEQSHYLEKPPKDHSHHQTLHETSKYQNVHMRAWQKWLGFAISLFLSACQREIKNNSCIWTPCIFTLSNFTKHTIYANWCHNCNIFELFIDPKNNICSWCCLKGHVLNYLCKFNPQNWGFWLSNETFCDGWNPPLQNNKCYGELPKGCATKKKTLTRQLLIF